MQRQGSRTLPVPVKKAHLPEPVAAPAPVPVEADMTPSQVAAAVVSRAPSLKDRLGAYMSASGETPRKQWDPVKVTAEEDIDTDLATRKNVVKKQNIPAFYGKEGTGASLLAKMQAKGPADLRGSAKNSPMLQKKLDELQSFQLESGPSSDAPKKKTIHDLEEEARAEMAARPAGLNALGSVMQEHLTGKAPAAGRKSPVPGTGKKMVKKAVPKAAAAPVEAAAPTAAPVSAPVDNLTKDGDLKPSEQAKAVLADAPSLADRMTAFKAETQTTEAPVARAATGATGGGRFQVKREDCEVCHERVYPNDKLSADGRIFHKRCFRCAAEQCGKVLGLGNYAALSGQYYCKPHFKQLFALKGNYSEGFGQEDHKKKWQPQVRPAVFGGIQTTKKSDPSHKDEAVLAPVAAAPVSAPAETHEPEVVVSGSDQKVSFYSSPACGNCGRRCCFRALVERADGSVPLGLC